MGNLLVLCKPMSKKAFGAAASGKDRRIVQVEKLDGKMTGFTTPVLVKDVMEKFPGGGIGLSKKAERHLPSSYELKLGKRYYLLPAVSLPSTSEGGSTMAADREKQAASGGIKRIKVVITKQQLQELLSKQVSVHDVVSATAGRSCSDDSFPYWKPKLQSIPEGNEL